MNPEELLAQIRDLLDQYLALGGDTPVAAEAQQFADAIDAATGGGGGDVGGQPPAPPEGMPPPDQSGAGGPPPMPTDFGTASDMALADLKKKKAAA